MKVTLDLSKLLEEGKITHAEHDRLAGFAAASTGSLAFNILIGFGVVAVAGGLIALVPDATTGLVLGGGLLFAGLALSIAGSRQWNVLAQILVLVGALTLGGGLVVLTNASIPTFLVIAAGFAAAATLARSSLLMALAVLALSSAIGARTGYEHATYLLGIEQPSATIALFGVFGIGAYLVSKRLRADYERLAITASRTAVFLVNFGFWIGSLWGDEPWRGMAIGRWVFIIGWAALLIALAVWAVRENRRWVVNVAAVFGAVHLYTQWFEHLGATPASVLAGGLVALGLALGLWHFNRKPAETAAAPAPP